MNRKTAWLLAIWLPLAAAASADVPAELRQRILAALAGELAPEDGTAAEVVTSGDLATVRSAAGHLYLLERAPEVAGAWVPVAQITAAGEAHFGDSVLLGSGTVLVAAPDTAGAGLGPGMAYVFQRNVGGSGRWGLVARLAPASYPPPGAVAVRPLAPAAAAAAPEEPAAVRTVAVAEAAPPEPPEGEEADGEPPRAAAAVEEPPREDPDPEEADGEPPRAAAAVEEPPREDPDLEEEADRAAAGEDLRFVVVANMSEKPRALQIAATLRAKGYPSEVHRNQRGFFVVTLARLPHAEARRLRNEAVSAGDVSPNAYLIVGSSFLEKVDP